MNGSVQSTSASRTACFDTACSNTLRTNRALPKPRPRGSASITSRRRSRAARVEVVLLARRHRLEDRQQLVGGVVGELERAREPALEAGIGLDELTHLVGVAGDDHRQVVTVVLHELHERVDRLASEVVLAAARQRVRLVDQHRAAQCRLEDRLRLGCRLTDVAGDEIGPVGLDQVPLLDDAEGAVDLAEQARHRGLPSSGVADEHEVAAGLDHGELLFGAQLLHTQQAGELADLGLDVIEPDQLVELEQQFLDRAIWRRRSRHAIR